MTEIKPTPICNEVCQLAEGPFWHDNTIHWLDIERHLLFRLQDDKAKAVYEFPSEVGCVVPARTGGFICGLDDGIYRLTDAGHLEKLADPDPDNPDVRFNDGKVDPIGRFVAGTISRSRSQKAALYSLSADGSKCKKIHGPVTNSNGLAWSRDGHSFFYIDTPTRQIQRFDYDLNTGELSNGRVVIEIAEEDGKPDGMCIDSEDCLWVGHFRGGQIARYNPANGEKMLKVPLPASNVTSCCFGGEHFDRLYITTASAGLSDDQRAEQPHAGKVFVCQPGVSGFPCKTWG